MQTSDKIRERVIVASDSYTSVDNISKYIMEGEIDALVDEVSKNMETVLRSLVIDVDRDHNTQDTARRVAKMFIHEIFAGRYTESPRITSFPNVQKYNELYVTGPITIRSTCAHHLMPIKGKAYIGVFPGSNVIGLSKFNRIVDWIASRPQIQEEMTVLIANEVMNLTNASGVAVLIQAEHFCMTHRGVKEHESDMTTASMLGVFDSDKSLKQEFYNIVGRMK
jgi:GTP cyclohydrolase I